MFQASLTLLTIPISMESPISKTQTRFCFSCVFERARKKGHCNLHTFPFLCKMCFSLVPFHEAQFAEYFFRDRRQIKKKVWWKNEKKEKSPEVKSCELKCKLIKSYNSYWHKSLYSRCDGAQMEWWRVVFPHLARRGARERSRECARRPLTAPCHSFTIHFFYFLVNHLIMRFKTSLLCARFRCSLERDLYWQAVVRDVQ